MFVCIHLTISKPHGNDKPKIYNRKYTQKRKSNPNTILNIVIKPQESKRGVGEKGPTKTNPPQNQQNGNKYIYIDNYLKC